MKYNIASNTGLNMRTYVQYANVCVGGGRGMWGVYICERRCVSETKRNGTTAMINHYHERVELACST